MGMPKNKKSATKKSPKLDVAKAYVRGEVNKQVKRGVSKLKNKASNTVKKYAFRKYDEL